jgi:hypothetical protein
MEWLLIVSLFSTPDYLIGEQKSKRSCEQALAQFKKEHKNDKDIKNVRCTVGTIVEPEPYTETSE